MKLERYGFVVVAAIATACASRAAPQQPAAAPIPTSETHVNAAALPGDDENKPRVGKAQLSEAPRITDTDAAPLGADKTDTRRREDGRGSSFSGYK